MLSDELVNKIREWAADLYYYDTAGCVDIDDVSDAEYAMCRLADVAPWLLAHIRGLDRELARMSVKKAKITIEQPELQSAHESVVAQMKALEKKCRRQAGQLSFKDDIIAHRNRQLDALHVVWGHSGCGAESGVNRYGFSGEITEELVQLAERQVIDLRRWFNARNVRVAAEVEGYDTK